MEKKTDSNTSLDEKELKKKSLKYSIKDGAFASAMSGFSESYIHAFVIFLKATNTQIGLLTSIPQLVLALFQILAARMTDKYKQRKKIVLVSVFLNAMILFLIAFIPYLTESVILLITLFSLYWLFNSFAGPAWSSWMGDLVDDDKRGKFFGRRNRITSFFSLISIFAAGLILNYLSDINGFLGFGVIFGIAGIARLISFYFLSKKYEPKYMPLDEDKFTFKQFLKRIGQTNFGLFTIYICLMMFATQIAGPFIVVFQLKVLKFSYLQYSTLIGAAAIVTFITVKYWGEHSDDFGNKKMFEVTGILMFLIPTAWIFIRDFWFALLAVMVGAFIWAGFNLSSSNFIYDTVRPNKRTQAIAYYNVLKGIAIFLGASLGGILSTVIPTPSFLMSNLIIVFIISAVLRLVVSVALLPMIKEVKIVKHPPHFIHFLTIMPVQGIVFDSVSGMKVTYKKLRESFVIIKNLKITKERLAKIKRRFIYRM
jgi:MFS family permease